MGEASPLIKKWQAQKVAKAAREAAKATAEKEECQLSRNDEISEFIYKIVLVVFYVLAVTEFPYVLWQFAKLVSNQ
ncbi:hypothetical protein ACTFSJ_27690 [Bacillus cereus group sp. MYBK12-2]|uniref:hypothetical protein n=1 Tax=Bacillus cereus group sp. MYBK12-2 TaxID=3450689 RepID=UPI0032FCCFBD|nr:hypothetical protein [Bacillus pacificus]HDR7653597.1 hypothetical protein [Bacillus pacificus]